MAVLLSMKSIIDTIKKHIEAIKKQINLILSFFIVFSPLWVPNRQTILVQYNILLEFPQTAMKKWICLPKYLSTNLPVF